MKKFVSIILAIIIATSVFAVVPITASAAETETNNIGGVTQIVASGTTGDCRWSLNDKGTLTISGEGAMGSASWAGSIKKIKKVNIENGVTYISNAAFELCENLESVTIPNTVKKIGDYAFNHCHSLTNVKIPDSVNSIGDGAFNGCGRLTTVELSNNIRTISNLLFFECISLEKINIPEGVTTIGLQAFGYCTELENITIPSSVTYIGRSAFYDCNIKEILIPDNVTSISDYAFADCAKLVRITIPDSVIDIESHVFNNCNSLIIYGSRGSEAELIAKENNIPFKEIGSDAPVESDYSLMWSIDDYGTLTISGKGGIDNYGSHSWSSNQAPWGTNIKSVIIENGITRIGDYAFEECDKLEDVTLPDSLTSIGSGAFSYCNKLENITIPDSVKRINAMAFSNCSKITSITIPDSVKNIGEYAIGYDDIYGRYKVNGFTIYGKVGSEAEKYANDNGFIFKETGTELPKLIGDVNGDNSIDVLDATVIQKYAVEKITLIDEQKEVADVNDDGIVNILDATMIQKFAVEKITEFKKKA